MKIFANHFYNFGFNITHISETRKEFHRYMQDVLKSPSHRCEDYLENRQQLSELHSFDWRNASGLGVILGYNNLRALDIDGSDDIETINHFLSILQLPNNYEWVVRSGSNNGFHIIFYCENHRYAFFSEKAIALASNLEFKNKFKHIEFRWFGHLVLPPSRHASSCQYEFLTKKIPYGAPLRIKLKNLDQLIKKYCSENRKVTWTTSRDFIYDLSDFEALKYKDVRENFQNNNKPHVVIFPDDEDESKGIPIECNVLINLRQSLWNFETLINLNKFEIDTKNNKPHYLFFDTETTGTPLDYDAPASKISNWPRIIQIAFIAYDIEGNELESGEYLIKPIDFTIPTDSTVIHGITNEKAIAQGLPLVIVLNEIHQLIKDSECLVAHNINFDSNVLAAEFIRNKMTNIIEEKEKICTMLKTIDFCSIKNEYGNKWPKLSELHFKLFQSYLQNAHDAMSDIKATAKCFWELKKREVL